MNFPVFDLHCDTALELTYPYNGKTENLVVNEGQIDLTRGRKLPGYAQLFAIYTSPNMRKGVAPTKIFEDTLRNFLHVMEEHSDLVAQARTGAEAARITGEGKVAAVLSLEGPAGIDFDPGRLPELAELGFRMTTLTWNEQNPLAGSHKTGGGLTEKGREFVRTAQKYGIRIDVSHLSEQAFWNIMDTTEGPVSASHSNSRMVWGVTRNLTDEQFRAIMETGGVAGLNEYTDFLGKQPVTLDTVCDHALHWLDLGGEKHIALGGDLDGCEELPQGFTGVESYPALAETMLRRGIPEDTVRDIFWNNAARLLD